MPRTGITGDQVQDETLTGDDISDGTLYRQDLNITSTGKAVVRKVLAGSDINISYTGIDPGTGDVTISFNSSTGGITTAQHRNLDQLVHEIAETFYYEVTRTTGKVSNETWWTTSGKTKKIRSIDYTYAGNLITQIVTKQYDSNGNTIVGETLTETYNYSGQNINSITSVLT